MATRSARPFLQDFLQSMRFHVVTDEAYALGGAVQDKPAPSAGFMSVSAPEVQVEAVTYKEGHYAFPRKYPGNTTVSDVTLQRGVAKADGEFWKWMYRVITGKGEYRATVTIQHFDRNAMNGEAQINYKNARPAKTYTLKNAFPMRYKVASDFDASTGDVSISELDLSYEHFVVDPKPT